MVKYEDRSHWEIAAEGSKPGDIFEAGDDENRYKSRDRKNKYSRISMQSVAPKNRHIVSLTKQFLSVHWDGKKPLLLGYSGGFDSKALLYSLLECGVKPTIAHLDHGWRKESSFEAQKIKEEAAFFGCPFLSAKFEPKERSEDEARKARYHFFLEHVDSHAVLLLAHQADDLAETVLKRIFEGAHLSRLGGMQKVSVLSGMSVWRPLLSVTRDEVLQFVEEMGGQAFDDCSNKDPSYLRARMREDMLPFLNQKFGKEIQKNLVLLSERSYELKKYLDCSTERAKVEKGPWGVLINLSGLEPIEQRHLLLNYLNLNRDQLETILDWIKIEAKSKELQIKTKKILVDGGRVFFEKS